MPRTINRFLLLIGFVYLSGCQSPQAAVDFDANADFSSLRTYMWQDGDPLDVGETDLDAALIDRLIRTSVDANLKDKGYELLSDGPVDFWVVYDASVHKEMQVRHNMNTVSYGRGIGQSHWNMPSNLRSVSETDVIVYDEGTVILYMIDPDTTIPLWRSVYQAMVHRSLTTEQRRERIDKAIGLMLDSFPP